MNINHELRQYVEFHLEGRSNADADQGYNHVAFINDLDAPNAVGLSAVQVGDLICLCETSPLCAMKKRNNRLSPGKYRVLRREWHFFDDQISTAGMTFLCIYLEAIP